MTRILKGTLIAIGLLSLTSGTAHAWQHDNEESWWRRKEQYLNQQQQQTTDNQQNYELRQLQDERNQREQRESWQPRRHTPPDVFRDPWNRR